MANEARNDMPHLWRNQPVERVEISLEEIRRKAQKLENQVQVRNLWEYGAGAIVVAAFTYYLWLFHSPLVRIGCALEIAGTLFVMYTLHTKGSARLMPAKMAFRTCVEFHREELQRQCDLLRGVWSWYLLPFIPGLAIFLLGLFLYAIDQPGASAHAWSIAKGFILTATGCALVFLGVGQLNQWAVRKIQNEIDALNALEREV